MPKSDQQSGPAVPPAPGTRAIAASLELEACGTDVWRSVAPDRNVGGEVFGGQYLGLAVSAAMRSAPGRVPHAMTAYFLRSAQADRPVDYRVERTRDGRGFAHRRVSASQDGREAFRAEVSFHEWEEGQPGHAALPPPVPPSTALPTVYATALARQDQLDQVSRAKLLGRRNFDVHLVDAEAAWNGPGARPELTVWVRPLQAPAADDPIAYYATLAYLSDVCVGFASRITHTHDSYGSDLLSLSLNHGIWFHAPVGPIEQLLYVLDSPFAGGGLGFNRGSLFDQDGRLLASVTQEALIRRTAPAA